MITAGVAPRSRQCRRIGRRPSSASPTRRRASTPFGPSASPVSSPANCRLISPLESRLTGLGDGRSRGAAPGLRVRTTTSVDGELERALADLRRTRRDMRLAGEIDSRPMAPPTAGGAGSSRRPISATVSRFDGLIVETFETATTWTPFAELHAAVLRRRPASDRRRMRPRLRHVAAEQRLPGWRRAVLHRDRRRREGSRDRAMDGDQDAQRRGDPRRGRDDQPPPRGRQRRIDPGSSASAVTLSSTSLRGRKDALDPAGIMNPGVLGLG